MRLVPPRATDMFQRIHPILKSGRQSLVSSNPRPFLRSARHQSTKTSRVDKITSRLPKSLQKYTLRLREAPVSHVVAFLILHELTAIVPLLGLFGLFHYTHYVPLHYMMDHFGGYVQAGTQRFEKYFTRKGWFGFGDEGDVAEGKTQARSEDEVLSRWNTGEEKYKILVEVALAYAVTKALLPLRIIGSVWATPWFAGVMGRTRQVFTRR